MDPERVELARSGDPSAFETLVEPRVGPMMRTAMAILGSEADARDAVQDTLVTAWRELASLRDPVAFDAWLTRILVNRCKRGLRGVATRRVREVPVDGLVGVVEPSVPDTAAASVERRALERAFERLSVDERTLLVRSGTGPRLEVVGRYDVASLVTVDLPPVTCDLAAGTGLPSCENLAALALRGIPTSSEITAVEAHQGAYCPPGYACPTVSPDQAHVIVRETAGDWLVTFDRDAGGKLIPVGQPLPSEDPGPTALPSDVSSTGAPAP